MNIGQTILSEAAVRLGRVALVKQDVHNDLYYRVSPAPPAEIVYSSILRTGPAALFSALDADFIVVHADDSPECALWKQKTSDCRHHDEAYYRFYQGEVSAHGRKFNHAAVSRSVDSVDWSKYDLVISIDIAVPSRIVHSHKSVVWAYYVSEPCMGLYRQSLEGPLFGYDFFFTLWPGGQNVERPIGVIDFPYFLQYAGCFADLDGTPDPTFEDRRSVSIERHSAPLLSSEDLLAITRIGKPVWKHGEVRELVANLRNSRFHLRLEGKLLWGNSLIEAGALGALVIGSPVGLKHRTLLRDNWCSSLADAVARMRSLAGDAELRAQIQVAQAELINRRCFTAPLLELTRAIGRLQK